MKQSALAHPTPYPELNEVLHDLVSSAAFILGDHFHAACLQGSFAMGDFDRDSDVDFLIVLKRKASDAQVADLQTMHGRIFDGACRWAQHLEGSYILKDVLRDPAAAGSELWYLDNGSRSLIRSNHCNTVVVRTTVREHGITLAGPDARSLVDPIPTETLIREVRATMRAWGESLLKDPRQMSSLWYQSYAVVSYCRMLQTLRTEKLWSKVSGMRWALNTLDPRWKGLIERAWAQRPGPPLKCQIPADGPEVKSTLEFIRFAMESSWADG